MQELAILCPGQGSQSPDMFHLVIGHARGREVLEAFSDAGACDLVARARAGDRLFDNDYAQPALVALACATWAVLEPWVPPPALFAGYSVGEVSAWSCAGAIDYADAATTAQARAAIMSAHAPPDCGMLAAGGLPIPVLLSHASGLHLAIVNSDDHVVLGGRVDEMVAAQDRLSSHGAWTRRLDVHVPSHTPLLEAASSEFAAWLQRIRPRPISAPVIRGTDGRRCLRPSDLLEALPRAIAQPIRWGDCQREIAECGAGVLLELAPGRALARLADSAERHFVARSVADFRSLEAVAEWVRNRLAD